MTDEELKQEITEVSGSLASLPESDESLTRDDRKSKHLLLLRKAVLDKIEQAKAKNDKSQEFNNSVDYAVLKAFGHRHPLLLFLARIKLKGSIYH